MSRTRSSLSWSLSLLLWMAMAVVAPARAWDHSTPQDLEQAVASGEFALVAFVLNDEPKSASLEPEWLAAAAAGTERLLSIDCLSAAETCARYDIASYPSVALFHSGKPVSPYRGARQASALLSFAARRKQPAVPEAVDAGNIAAFKAADEIVFIAFLDPQDHASAAEFSDVAARYRDEFRFGTSKDIAVAEAEGVRAPVVVCYRLDDEHSATFSSLDSTGKLDAWVQEASRSVLGDLTLWNRQRLLDRGWPMVYLFAPTESERQELRQTLYKFAKSYYDSLTSVVVDPLEFPELMGQMGLDANVFPAGAVHQLSKDRIYRYPRDKPLDSRGIQRWGLDVYQGRIKPWTPPGVTTTYEDLGPTRVATGRVSLRSFPGMKIKISGHDEL
ncbi:thioredoxin-like domain-containing protein [Lasiosphaeria ovina]|uniref:Protein disulfide-isomerase n=1 Tax=Lasiosphaeria ovina TaxID=92902 RepID=A0AAE0KN09_9PEZI|nr:thioredoxin-like domain-containing protein [Lasiosphaeria ovina]